MDSTNSSSIEKSGKRNRFNYKVRWFYSKGAFLILLWTTLISATLWSYVADLGQKFVIRKYLKLIVISSLTFFAIPFLGWLADAKFGNYRIFKLNCFFLQVAMIVNCIQIVYFPMLNCIVLQDIVTALVFTVSITSTSVCIMTALQLGLDQMPDASSTNVLSFISWFVFSVFFGISASDWLSNILLNCINLSTINDMQKGQLFSLFPVICMVIICSSMFLLAPKWLTIEPKSPKAIKTIHHVLKFAVKHKAPIYRSALTYWEEDVPSRLDLGKTKYGGPFTIEQVEDVKTFLRILVMSFPICVILIACRSIYIDDRIMKFGKTLKDHLNPNITECTSNIIFTFSSAWLSGSVTTIVYEFALYPLIRNKVPSSIRRIGGVALLNLLLNILYLATPYVWVSVIYIGVFNGFLNVLLLNGIFEFVCAQSPYNMRGLLTGYMTFLTIVSFSLNYLIGYLLLKLSKQYYVEPSISTALSVIGLVLYCLLARWYKWRVRDEDYNAHRVVEEVYDRYLSHVQYRQE